MNSKLILKCPRFVLFGANLALLEAISNISDYERKVGLLVHCLIASPPDTWNWNITE